MTRVLAPAKINLFLEILRKRPDGYHDLRSLLVPISLCDEMTFDVQPGGEIATTMEVADLPRSSEWRWLNRTAT